MEKMNTVDAYNDSYITQMLMEDDDDGFDGDAGDSDSRKQFAEYMAMKAAEMSLDAVASAQREEPVGTRAGETDLKKLIDQMIPKHLENKN